MERRKTRVGEQARIPYEQAIGLRFKLFGDVVDEQVVNISAGGMFIRTRNPHPVGSVFEFELPLDHDLPLVAGKAQVAWVRRRSEDADLPIGMGVRFVELEDDGRRHIAALVAAHTEADAPPSKEAPPQGIPATAAAAPPPPSPAPAAPGADAAPARQAPVLAHPPEAAPAVAARSPSTEVEPRRSRLPWILLTIVLAATLALTLWRRPALDASLAAESLTREQPPLGATGTSAAPPAETAFEEPEPLQLVHAWARAWSEQRVDDYLDAYSPRFSPPQGLDWAAWESQRRARILAPESIEVGLGFVELEKVSADRSQVRFVQVYESDSYRDVVRKVLDLERDQSGWKILRETVAP